MISFKCWESVLDVVRERWPQCGTSSEESACNAGGTGSIPGSGRSPGGEYGNPLQYSCLGNLMDSGAWWATVHGVPKSQIWLSNWVYVHTHTHTHTSERWSVLKMEKGNTSDECRWPLKDPRGKEMRLPLEPPPRSTVQLTSCHTETHDRSWTTVRFVPFQTTEFTEICYHRILETP